MNTIKLADVSVAISKGSTPRGKVNYSTNEDNRFLRVTDMCDFDRIKNTELSLSNEDIKTHKIKLWPIDTVLVSIEGTIGKVAILKESMAMNQAVAGIILDDKILMPEYVMYYLKGSNAFERLIKGTIMPAIRLGDLANIEVPILGIVQQKQVINIYSFDMK